MKCTRDRCWSPLACSGFGYCRERNFDGEQDRVMLWLWQHAATAEDIGRALHMPETRVLHELNRILREQAEKQG